MRTTITLDPDVAAEVARLRREHGTGLSDAVNELARAGMRGARRRPAFRQRSAAMGLRMDVSNVAELLDDLDGPTAR